MFFVADGYGPQLYRGHNISPGMEYAKLVSALAEEYAFKGVRLVITFEKEHEKGAPLRVHVILTENNPMETILGFYSNEKQCYIVIDSHLLTGFSSSV